MENIIFQKHNGLLNSDDQTVIFYGLGFKNIIDAMKMLKQIPAKDNIYYGWYYNLHKGILNSETGEVFLDLRWLPTEKFAEDYVDMKKK